MGASRFWLYKSFPPPTPSLFIVYLVRGYRGGTKPPVSHIIHHMGEEGEGNVAGPFSRMCFIFWC